MFGTLVAVILAAVALAIAALAPGGDLNHVWKKR